MIRSTFRFPKRWQAVPAQLFDVLYPQACLVCSNELKDSSGSVMLCEACRPTAAHRHHAVESTERDREHLCRECGTIDESIDGSYLCLPCRVLPLGAAQIHSLWHYTGPIESMLKRYKYTWQPLLADYFAAELAAFAVERMPHRPWDVVAAVPSSPGALRARGFHHLGLLARKTAKLLGVPADVLALRATAKSRSQAQLSPAERMLNAQDAFSSIPWRVEGQRVLLLDDVITSGESIRNATRVLHENGASSVVVCSLARSVNFPVLRRALAAQPAKNSKVVVLRKTALLTLISLIACSFTACGGDTDKLEQNVQELRADVQELQNLRKEVDYLRASMSRSPSGQTSQTLSDETGAPVRDPEADQMGFPSGSASETDQTERPQERTETAKAAPQSAASHSTGSQSPVAQPGAQTAVPQTTVQSPISPATFSTAGAFGQHMADDPFLGKPDGEMLIMAFVDYECGPCREFYKESFNALKEEFVDSGKVSLYLRDFPLEANANSKNAATLAHCAGEQGAYWPMFQTLFENPTAVDNGEFESLAKKLESIDQGKLKKCYGSGRYEKELEQDIQDGVRLGARGAPGFFIGRKEQTGSYRGVFVRGAQPLRVLRSEIKKMLSAQRKVTV